MARDDGGPAFPVGDNSAFPPQSGMMLRDYFAGQVLVGLICNAKHSIEFRPSDDADYCYRVADAMLAARATTDRENEG